VGCGAVRNIGRDRGDAQPGVDGIERVGAAGNGRHLGAVRHQRLDQSQAEATASAGDDSTLIFEAHQFCSLCLGAATTSELRKRSQPMSAGAAGRQRVWPLGERRLPAPYETSAGFRTDLTNPYQYLVRLARWRATESFA
jgi:hypothetical protein